MKTTIALILVLAFTGCARFTTKQTDISYDDQGKPTRSITTKVSAGTLLDANSALAKSKALNTDKSQSAELGGLSQNASSANILAALQAMVQVAGAVAK